MHLANSPRVRDRWNFFIVPANMIASIKLDTIANKIVQRQLLQSGRFARAALAIKINI